MLKQTGTVLVIALGLTAVGACKKKKTEEGATTGGSAMVNPAEGSAGMATGSGSAAAPAQAAPKTGRELAAMYLECTNHLNQGTFDDFKKTCLGDGYVAHEAGRPDAVTADKMVAEMAEHRAAFPDMKFAPQLVLVNGRNLFGVGLVTGTHTVAMKGPMGEVPPTNKKTGLLLFHRLAVNDENKVAEEWSYMDPATMMGQLGLLPKEAGPQRPPLEKGFDGAPVIVIAADDEKERANLDTVKQANAAFNAHKSADAMAFFTDDAIEADQAGREDDKGKAEIEKSWAMLWKAFSDFKIEMKDTFAAGDYVVALGTYAGTNDGDLGPKLKQTGKPVGGAFAEVYKLRDGKIAELWRFRNDMEMAAQLGMMPAPGAPGAGPATPATGDAPAKGDAPAMKKGA
ncbi:MAG: ester cyclase [Myxococcota bacterium]|nr:ester cyclase [Myxococcota bacterium]